VIPLVLKDTTQVAGFPEFVVKRLTVGILFEPVQPGTPDAYTFCDSVLIDTGSPYHAIPAHFHASGHIKIRQDLGRQPYSLLSDDGSLTLQRFVEVGFRFLVRSPDGSYSYAPEKFLPVKGYLLDAGVRPEERVLFGLARSQPAALSMSPGETPILTWVVEFTEMFAVVQRAEPSDSSEIDRQAFPNVALFLQT
jgi:hypothetical protein